MGIKKESLQALALFLLIPLVLALGGLVFSAINPELAAGHPNYVRNFHLLTWLKNLSFLAALAVAGVMWLWVCFLVIRSKKQSRLWIFLAALGPLGLAALSMLNDRAAAENNRYARFLRGMNGWARAAWELGIFMLFSVLAYQAMVLNRTLMIHIQAARTGMTTAQIVALQDSSGGMWAFAEGNEMMVLVILFYLLLPLAISLVSRRTSRMTPSREV